MTKFCPGPWQVDPLVKHDVEATNVHAIYGSDETQLAWVEEGDDQWANTCLIAAAPDLYAALTEVLEHMTWDNPQGEAAYKAAKVALAKAEGR